MATGACGINCDVCRLNAIGLCSTCGPGTSIDAQKKRDAQIRLFGQGCPILECALLNQHPYCLRDCQAFPCENFKNGVYPFSKGFLDMQARRRKETMPIKAPYGDKVDIPPEYWDDLAQRDVDILCIDALCDPDPPDGLILKVLNEKILVDLQNRSLKRATQGAWEPNQDLFLELLVLVYLCHVTPFPLSGQMISVHDLKDAHFFQGPHELKIRPLLDRFGHDRDAFIKAAENVGGERTDMADAAYCFYPFPKVPVHYLLWEGDAEFTPTLKILFDKSIERHLAADAIWGTVNMVSEALLWA